MGLRGWLCLGLVCGVATPAFGVRPLLTADSCYGVADFGDELRPRNFSVVSVTNMGAREEVVLSAELAIDLSRELEVPLVAVTVAPTVLLGEDMTEQRRGLARVADMASLYHLRVEALHREGNPVRVVAGMAGSGDLVVMAHRVSRRPSFFNPDTSLHIANRVGASVVVLPYH